MDHSPQFGDLLRSHRRAAGLTQSALAEAAELSDQAISLLERGVRRRPHRATVLALAAALQLNAIESSALLAAARGQDSADTNADSVPRQLPPAVPDFVGRSAELGRVTAQLKAAGRHSGMAVVTVHGPAGVGKTTLAIQIAHRVARDFPDGQIYLDLCGYGPGEPMTAGAALTVLLTSLGVPENAVPVSVEAASAQYRSMLAESRTLVVLDNASEETTLRHLLPGDAGCAVLVTGRRNFDQLATTASVQVAPLGEDDCLDLLGQIIGSGRVQAEIVSARTIARASHGLPLLVRLAGARLNRRNTWRLTDVADQIRDERIDHLGVMPAVESAVATSLESLRQSPRQPEKFAAAAFDFLGLLEAAELTESAIAALIDVPVVTVGDVLAHLVDLYLIDSPRPGFYRLHDLVRTVAAERAIANIGQEAGRQAFRRVANLYLVAAWECQKLTHFGSGRFKFARVAIGPVSAEILLPRLAWLDGEISLVIALVEQIAGSSDDASKALLLELGFALFGYFEVRSRWSGIRRVASLCRAVAATEEERAWFEYESAIPDWEQGHFSAALSRFESALSLSETVGDPGLVSRTAFGVARTLDKLGRIDEAVPFAERSIAAARSGNRRVELGGGLLALGALHVRFGRLEEAEAAFAQGIDIALQDNDLRRAARRSSLAGESYTSAGLHERAIVHLQEGLRLYERATDPNGITFAYRLLGSSLLAWGRVDEAEAALEKAAKLGRDYSDGQEEARALGVLAEVRLRRGDRTAALRDLNAAAGLFDDLGMAQAGDIRRRIDELDL